MDRKLANVFIFSEKSKEDQCQKFFEPGNWKVSSERIYQNWGGW